MDNDECSHEQKAAVKGQRNASKKRKAQLAFVCVVIEVASLALWQKADEFSGPIAKILHKTSECGFLFGIVCAAYTVTRRHVLIWSMFALMCGVVWVANPREIKPNLKLYLQIGDQPTSRLYLTNGFLFGTGNVSNKVDSSGSFSIFKGEVDGCLVFPVQLGETNKEFNLVVQNDSPTDVSDMRVSIAFPKSWNCKADPKWHNGDWALYAPDWQLNITNLQCWVAEVNWKLHEHDCVQMPPVVSPCVPELDGSRIKGGLFGVMIRMSGEDKILLANVMFIPCLTNTFKPYVALGERQANGTMTVPLPETYEDRIF